MRFAIMGALAAALCGSVMPAALANSRWSDVTIGDQQWGSLSETQLAKVLKLDAHCTNIKAIDGNANAKAQMILAIAYRNGICVTEDQAKAEAWIESAAKLGDARAIQERAVLLVEDARSLDDLKTAYSLSEKAASLGDARAKASLALALLDGVPNLVEADPVKSFPLMREAIRAGIWPVLLMYTGVMRESDGGAPGEELSPVEITAYWKQGADTGSRAAIKAYADRLANGEGVVADPSTAAILRQKIEGQGDSLFDPQLVAALQGVILEWRFRESDAMRKDRLLTEATAGNADAMYELASLLEYGGNGVEPDPNGGFAWYKKAAELGNGPAVYAVTDRLFDKTSPYFNEQEGIRLLRQQMLTDKTNGGEYRRTLADHLANTDSSYRDVAGAQKLLREGLALGDAYVIEALARMYVPAYDDSEETAKLRDPVQAIKLYERFLALPEGKESYDTMATLASLYSQNQFEFPDGAAKANSWVLKSVNGGSALGNVYLGDFIFYGDAQQVPSYSKAKSYWLKAQELDTSWDLSARIAMADEAINEDRTTTTVAAMEALAVKYDEGIDRPLNWTKAMYWYQRAVDAGTTNRDTLRQLAGLYDLEGPAGKSEPLWRRLSVGSDDIAAEAKTRVAQYDAARAAARPATKASPTPQPRAVAGAPTVAKAWGNAKVPIGKEFICEMQVWSGLKSLGIVSRDRKPKYDDAFRLEFLSRTQVRISGSDELKNGVRSIVVQGNVAQISDPYPPLTGMLGVQFWNVTPFQFNLSDYTFEEVWDNSWEGRTIKKGSCD